MTIHYLHINRICRRRRHFWKGLFWEWVQNAANKLHMRCFLWSPTSCWRFKVWLAVAWARAPYLNEMHLTSANFPLLFFTTSSPNGERRSFFRPPCLWINAGRRGGESLRLLSYYKLNTIDSFLNYVHCLNFLVDDTIASVEGLLQ